MRPSLVVIPPPRFDGDASIGQARKPALVQTLVAESAVEAFRVRFCTVFPGSMKCSVTPRSCVRRSKT